jgi:putative transposase
MPRIARVVVPGAPHHVTQRGNNRQDVFFVAEDRQRYLQLLAGQCERFGVQLHAFCLMNNHIHLIATPQRSDSLARALGRAHHLYTLYINRLHGRVGHLWQNRFFSCVLDEAHLWAAWCYVERNPVRAGLVSRAWEYAWSSAPAHCLMQPPPQFLHMALWKRIARQRDWKEALMAPQDEKELSPIRRCTLAGRPLASDNFVSKLEIFLGRRLRPQPHGRPKGWKRKPQA